MQLYKESTFVHTLNVCNPSAGLFILNHLFAQSFNSSLKQELIKWSILLQHVVVIQSVVLQQVLILQQSVFFCLCYLLRDSEKRLNLDKMHRLCLCFEYFIVWFIFAKDSKITNWFSFSCSTFTAQLYIQIQIHHNVPINLTAVAQITVILLMSSMKEIALHFEEGRYWQ